MTPAVLDEPQSSAPVKGRGGWYRNQYGEAVVSHPTRNSQLVYAGGSSLWEFADGPYRGDPTYGERGTWVHDLCALACQNLQPTPELIAEGEALGIPEALQRHIYRNWIDTRNAHGITTLHIELPIVHDGWRVATNADRIEQCADGEVVGGDIKTAGDVVKVAYHVQLAVIPGSLPYNQETGGRSQWGTFRPSSRRAHVWHYPLSAALKCEPGDYPDWTLVEVDLRHGIVLGNTLASLKFEALDRDSFSIVERPTIAPAPEVSEATGLTVQQPPPAAPVGDGPHTTSEPPPGSTGAGAPPRGRNGRPIPSPAEQLAALAGTPQEGGPADAKAFDALQAKYAALPPAASAWLTSVVSESMAADVSFHAKDNRTVRRFELIRALVIVASSGAYVDPEAVRSLLYHVHGEVALWPALTVGHLVGSLGADGAAEFAQRCWEVVG